MDNDFLAKMLRQLLQFGAGVLVAKGFVSADTANLVIGVVLAAATAGYVAYRNANPAVTKQ